MYLLGIIIVFGCFGAIARGAPRVIGGDDAPDHKYPHQVSLRDFVRGHFCSGSILNEHWILTAAHCVFERSTSTYTISAGTNYLNISGDVYIPQLSIVHEEYNNFLFNDIALIRINDKFIFNKFVKPIAIPAVDIKDYTVPAWFAGWGSTRLGGSAPNNLQEIELKLVTIDECKKSQPSSDETHICTYNKYSEGICHGDSGGPLVVDGFQVGIASYVTPCAVGDPDVYTRVFSFNKWIETTIERFDFIIT